MALLGPVEELRELDRPHDCDAIQRQEFLGLAEMLEFLDFFQELGQECGEVLAELLYMLKLCVLHEEDPRSQGSQQVFGLFEELDVLSFYVESPVHSEMTQLSECAHLSGLLLVD